MPEFDSLADSQSKQHPFGPFEKVPVLKDAENNFCFRIEKDKLLRQGSSTGAIGLGSGPRGQDLLTVINHLWQANCIAEQGSTGVESL